MRKPTFSRRYISALESTPILFQISIFWEVTTFPKITTTTAAAPATSSNHFQPAKRRNFKQPSSFSRSFWRAFLKWKHSVCWDRVCLICSATIWRKATSGFKNWFWKSSNSCSILTVPRWYPPLLSSAFRHQVFNRLLPTIAHPPLPPPCLIPMFKILRPWWESNTNNSSFKCNNNKR